MANLRMTLLDLLNKEEQGADTSFLRAGVRLLAQELMDAEVTQPVGAGAHERSQNRLTWRNATGSANGTRGSARSTSNPQAPPRGLLPELVGAAASA